ncbi:MAG: prepilin-type N-terminal cleavage/methylation domain-containing protein [Thermodesulfobacteriota bacterium]|nr:prepilin-type N-terminal cleavage/methylation domain-containing protein [Thermodesulfobacteriota bacterium]
MLNSTTKDDGFTIIELLIAMVVGLVLLGAMYSVFTMHNKIFNTQEQIAEMQQNARAAMDIMTREIRMAGYDPLGSAGAGIISAASDSLNFTLDTTGTADSPDGDINDSNENITYSLYTTSGIQKLGRKSTAAASNQPVAEHVQSLAFQYRDANGATTATPANVRRIQVTLTVQTAIPDPDYAVNSGYRTYSLTSVITPRNLGL